MRAWVGQERGGMWCAGAGERERKQQQQESRRHRKEVGSRVCSGAAKDVGWLTWKKDDPFRNPLPRRTHMTELRARAI